MSIKPPSQINERIGQNMSQEIEDNSVIQQAINRLQLQIEACLERSDALAHRLQPVSRTPVQGINNTNSSPDRCANSYLSIHLHELCDRLGELERRICLQIDLLEI